MVQMSTLLPALPYSTRYVRHRCWQVPEQSPTFWKQLDQYSNECQRRKERSIPTLADYEATIKCLLEHGLNPLVQFRIGQGEAAETLTPLEMAIRCAAEDGVIQLLAAGHKNGPEYNSGAPPTREIKDDNTGVICELCLSVSLARCHESITESGITGYRNTECFSSNIGVIG